LVPEYNPHFCYIAKVGHYQARPLPQRKYNGLKIALDLIFSL